MSDENEHNLPPEDRIPEKLQPSPAEQFPVEEGTDTGEQQTGTVKSPRKFKLTWQFAGGFLGWFIVTIFLWGMSLNSSIDENLFFLFAFSIFALNLIIPLVLGLRKKTRQVAFGILAAMGLNLIISLAQGLTTNAVCFIPFFILN